MAAPCAVAAACARRARCGSTPLTCPAINLRRPSDSPRTPQLKAFVADEVQGGHYPGVSVSKCATPPGGADQRLPLFLTLLASRAPAPRAAPPRAPAAPRAGTHAAPAARPAACRCRGLRCAVSRVVCSARAPLPPLGGPSRRR